MTGARISDQTKAVFGFAIVAGGAVMFFLLFLGIIPKLFGGGGTTVRASFASTGSLHFDEPVRIDGVTVGKVQKITANPGGGATVEMRIDESAGPIYANARASIKWRTLLGASYAISLERGTPGVGKLGDQIIPERRTSFQAELDDVTRALSGSARQGLRSMMQELPKGFRNPEQPGGMLAAMARVTPDVADGMTALQGLHPSSDLNDLTVHTGQAMAALNAPQERLRALVQDAAITTQTTGGRAQEIQDTITTAAAALPRVRSTLANLDDTLDTLTPVLAELRDTADAVAPALSALRPTVVEADSLLTTKAMPLLRSLRPTASALAAAARKGVPLLDELDPSLERIDKSILPDLATVSPESGRATYEMIGPAVAGLDGVGSHYDSQSVYIRFTGNGSERVWDQLPCRAYFADPDASALIQCQALGAALGGLFGTPANGGKR